MKALFGNQNIRRFLLLTYILIILTSNNEVATEQPAGDQRLFGWAGRAQHDIQIWGIEAESCGRKTISDQVDPQQLDWNKSFGHAQRSSQENTRK